MNWFWGKKPVKQINMDSELRKDVLRNRPDSKELKAWRHSECTIYFNALLEDEREEIKEDIVRGVYTGDSTDKTAQLLAKAIGKCEQLEDVLYAIEHSGEDEDER